GGGGGDIGGGHGDLQKFLEAGGLRRRCLQKDYGGTGGESFLGIFRFFFPPWQEGGPLRAAA
ncbi:hypothetical protein, partial [Comamonas sp. JC664]|uniref:hypothetical protein n=1 Tax=Comamonas sp. JC664 TaxID=2801917 RepID=UPI001E65107C